MISSPHLSAHHSTPYVARNIKEAGPSSWRFNPGLHGYLVDPPTGSIARRVKVAPDLGTIAGLRAFTQCPDSGGLEDQCNYFLMSERRVLNFQFPVKSKCK